MNAKVSICIPTYNRKDYLKNALESVLAQTYKDYEVVIVDDGSTDGTEEMIKNVGYNNVRYYWVDHIGQYPVRNKLIELARADYITFLDSDDLLFPDALHRLMEVMDSYGPDVFVYGSYIGIDEYGNDLKRKQRKLPSGNIVSDLFEFIYVRLCGTVGAKRVYEKEGGFDTLLTRCADYKFMLELSLKYKFIPVDGPVYKKRRHRDNLSDRSFVGRKIEFSVLEDFYYNGGGREVVPRHQAMKRLSKEGYRVGRCAIKEGMRETARQLLSQSFRRRPNFKSLLWLMIASGGLHPALCKRK